MSSLAPNPTPHSGTPESAVRTPQSTAPRYYTFWSINGPLERTRLRRQLADFKAAGLHGVVFHPRFYPGIPPYLSDDYLAHVNDAILHAKELGLRFWLYDENGWPSGTGDGKVLAQYPDSGAMRLDLTREPTADTVGSFHTDAANRLVPADTPGATTWYLAPRKINYVDSLDPRVLGHFLDLIHERYRTGLDPVAWDYIEAIFFDEPESGMIKDPFPETAGIPWSRIMPEKLRATFGDGYLKVLPLLFARGEGYQEIRARFWELVTDTLIGGFFAPYHAWCEKHGKQFIGHVKGEEHPLFQLPMVGSCHRIFRHLSMPGIDALERYPSLDFFPRQAGSFARQFGHGRVMVECFGGAGWGASPENLERYLLWLGRNGITDFVFHLSQYRLDTPAITDWPPSEPLHLSWKDAFPAVLERVSRELAARPPVVPATLVVAPYRGLMAEYEPWELMQTNGHNASTFPDTLASRINSAFLAQLEKLKTAGIAYDVTDERTLEEDGVIENGRVRLGQATYSHLVVDPGAILRGDWKKVGSVIPNRPSCATSAEQPRRVKDNAPYLTIPLQWTIPALPENAWLLEPDRLAPAEFTVTFATATLPAGLVLHFADDLVEAFLSIGRARPSAFAEATADKPAGPVENEDEPLGDRPLPLTIGYDGTYATLPALPADEHTLRFRTVREVPGRPFVWLKGAFTLASASPFTSGPNGTLRTAGPFIAGTTSPDPAGELTASGLPFLHKSVQAESTFTLHEPASSLRFNGVQGDTLHLTIDGRPAGWIWGPDWLLTLPQPLAVGTHRLHVALVPSTYNHFGPHHYYLGDWPVISPGQVLGEKNFADPPDAPARTHIPEWHFKPLRLPAGLTVSGPSQPTT
ncbi:MAG: hypothetical protein KIT44_13675 [Opitutaceae bacterium]|nr:hypothetical protein [Opitutaceae bacterium]